MTLCRAVRLKLWPVPEKISAFGQKALSLWSPGEVSETNQPISDPQSTEVQNTPNGLKKNNREDIILHVTRVAGLPLPSLALANLNSHSGKNVGRSENRSPKPKIRRPKVNIEANFQK